MTNFQQAANREQQQRLLLGIPIGIGALLAVAVFGVVVLPQWLTLRDNRARIDRIDELEQRLPLLRDQLARTSTDREQATRRRQKILTLIQGSGEFTTFLAQLDREARTHRVQLDLFEPMTAPAPERSTQPEAGADPAPKAPPKPPLEAAGLVKDTVLLTAQGPYPNLLAFVRAVERLSLLVVPSDFALALVELPTPGDSPQSTDAMPPPTDLQLKLLLSYYSVTADEAGDAPPPQDGESGAGADGQPAT
jgi:type IV pilus assembly protein PilO